MAKAGLGYDAERDGSYRAFQWRQKRDINLTLRRHFLNSNPANPFQVDDPDYVGQRPLHSVLPNPIDYFHLESLTTGVGLLAWSGAFLPIPIGSVLGTIEKGGWKEFKDGIRTTIDGNYRARLDQPPAPEEFRIRSKRL
jgi:hypothetical protein